ncbi:hypothetical protein ACN9K5_00770 [Aliarcobacter butzleri]|uniref:hypothetical protein n=1 Tax=Aliarcobacter butzleri TaxID=28197 RepID=UPI003B216F2E
MEKYLLLILGAVIGFITAILKDILVERTKKKNKYIELKREKAEEVYILLEKWANSFFNRSNYLTLVMKKNISYNEYLDYIVENPTKVDFICIEMLLKIYFKDMLPSYELILKQRDEINDIIALHKKEYQNGCFDGNIYIEPLMRETLITTKLVEKLKEEVATFVNNMNS